MGKYASPVPTPAHITPAQKALLVAEVLEQVGTSQSYTHPSTHPADMIVEDSTHRFATDTEKSTWSAKQDPLTGEITSHSHPSSGGLTQMQVEGFI